MNIPKKYLKETVLLVENIVQPDDILKILMQDKTIKMNSTSDDPNFQDYKKLVEKVRSGYKQRKNGAKSRIILDNFKLSKRAEAEQLGLLSEYESLGSVLTKLKEFMDSKGQYNPDNVTSNIIQITTLEILCGYLNVPVPKKPVEPDPEPEEPEEEEILLKGKLDWTAYKAKKLANPNGKAVSEILDEFYEEYYKIEYAGLESVKDKDNTGIVDKLKSLNKILIIEFNKLGYNPEVNPFAQFLKLLIKHDKELGIFSKLNTNNYGAIHNAFIERYITGNKLGNFNTKNILFCNDLYNYKGLDIVQYLALYKQTIDAAKSNDKYADNPELLVVKMFIQQNRLADDYVENINKLLELSETEVILPGKGKTAKMRSYLEIVEMYQYLFKAVPKKEMNDSAIKEIIAEAEQQNILLALTKHVLELHRLGDDQEAEEKWFDKFNPNYSRKEETIQKAKKILLKYIIEDKKISALYKKLKARLIEINNKTTKAGS